MLKMKLISSILRLKLPINKRYYCNLPNIVNVTQNTTDTDFLMDAFNLDLKTTRKLIKKQKIKIIDRSAFIKSLSKLKEFGYTNEQILEYPSIIETSKTTLDNHFVIFQECGFHNILVYTLCKYVILMNRSITMLKTHGHIPYNQNVVNNIISKIEDIEITYKDDISESITLNTLRQNILNLYLINKLEMSNDELNKLWKTYPRIKHKSFKSIGKMIDILKNEFNYSSEKIKKHGYLLHGDALNVEEILRELPILAGQNIHEILIKRPKIMMTNCESLIKIVEIFRKYEIPDSSVSRCIDVFTLGPTTVTDRLEDLKNIEEFNVLVNNPRILRLVHYQNKAITRLDYLRQIKIKCASLHILCSNSEAFEKYARDGSDRTKGRDVSNYLAKELNKPELDIRIILARHPNSCHVPIISVKTSLDYLKIKEYKDDDIFKNLHLLLYPVNRIEEKITILKQKEADVPNLDINWSTITKSNQLGLCLYLIERDFHFTGDGIWTDQISLNDSLYTPIIEIPRNLIRQNKYGVKPLERMEKFV